MEEVLRKRCDDTGRVIIEVYEDEFDELRHDLRKYKGKYFGQVLENIADVLTSYPWLRDEYKSEIKRIVKFLEGGK